MLSSNSPRNGKIKHLIMISVSTTESSMGQQIFVVYQTELTAIHEACKYLSTYTHTNIIIWSDSLSSIQAISSLSTRSRTARDCYDSLNALGSTNTLEIRWIAAHIGLWGNEKADELAKLGTTSESTLNCPIPQSHIKRLIDDKVNRLNQESWLTDGPRHTKLTLGHKHAKIIKNLNTTLNKNRQDSPPYHGSLRPKQTPPHHAQIKH